METTRWDKIQELFHGAADLPAAAQREFLRSACAGDDGLAADVLALLDEDARGGSPLDRGVADLAQQVLAGGSLPPIAGHELGPYRLKRLLGEGGMGVVYLAERADLGSLVAIKLLSDAWLSPARLERFAAEQRTLAQLDHPAIARLYDAGALEDGTPYFVMEYVDGKPLTEHCRERSAGIPEMLGLFRALCEAVQFAHRHAIIHRDIKPSNVLVKRDGSVRLLDFGIAKHLEHLDTPANPTRTGFRPMTPAYAAPEQFAGDRVGIYTDVYSLGVVLYELLSGKLPFDRSTRSPSAGSQTVVEKEPERPSVVARAATGAAVAGKAAWGDLDVLVMTAMHRDPRRRYASVEALIRDIDHYLHGEPLEARPDSFGYRLRKFVTRNFRALAIASATLALVVGLVGFFTARLATARDAALAEAARTVRIRGFMERLLTGGDDEVGPGKDLRVITLLDRGAKEARALDDDPEVQADLLQTLGSLYQSLGDLDDAESLLSSALAKRKALFGERSGEVVESLEYLAMLRDQQARFEEAEQLFRQAFDIGKRHLPAGDQRTITAALALGREISNRGRFEEAIQVLNEAMKLESPPESATRNLSDGMNVLANAHYRLGHYAEANALYQRGLELDKKTLGERHPDISDHLFNLAKVQLEWGRYDEAEKLDRQAVAIIEGFYQRDQLQTADALTMLGKALVPQGKLVEAATILAEALTTEERIVGKEHPLVAMTLGELGNIALAQGRLDDADALFGRQKDIYLSVYGERDFHCAVAHVNLGRVALERKNPAVAEQIIRQAVAIYRQSLPADHTLRAVAEIHLGRALVSQGRFADALEHTQLGYGAFTKQPSAPARWLLQAREDLVAIYDATGQAAQASRFRADVAAGAH